VPVSLVKGKTLLQLLCEKTRAASIQAGQPLSIAIMTSPLNHEMIVDYLEMHGRFGLESTQISYFMQGQLPFLDDKGHWLWEASGKIAQGPDGNGHALSNFYHSGIWRQWKEKGIEYVNHVLIDNPLADPFDPALVAAHVESDVEVTLKCVPRKDSLEKVGVVGLEEGRITVVEYSDLPDQEKMLSHWHVANISLFCFSMDFIAKAVNAFLPWHLVRKGGLWKFETFIFDVLKYTNRTKVLLYPREDTYAPLKNALGDFSLDTVRSALFAADKKAYERVSGYIAPEIPFELDAVFHYPTPELFEAWKGKELPRTDYIENLVK
ncbi:MAG: UTP--glucose-1-phosphate uridylyltransferase, partial [Chlamydiota bacterium]